MKPEALLFFYAEMMMMMTENLRISCNLQQWLYAWEPSSAFTTKYCFFAHTEEGRRTEMAGPMYYFVNLLFCLLMCSNCNFLVTL